MRYVVKPAVDDGRGVKCALSLNRLQYYAQMLFFRLGGKIEVDAGYGACG